MTVLSSSFPFPSSGPSASRVPPPRAIKGGPDPYEHAAFVSFLNEDQRLRDLRDATLDGMVLRDIDFSGADLRGANLSDVRADSCIFREADMVDVCLSDSFFDGCDFRYVRWGAVMMMGARIMRCRFAGAGALALPWASLGGQGGNTYETRDGRVLSLDIPPILMTGLAGDIALIDGKILLNDTIID